MSNKLIIVLVVYNEQLSDLPSYLCLKKMVQEHHFISLYIYDNSVEAQVDELMHSDRVVYVHDRTNPGLATAYNCAMQFFYEQDGELLLLLDQDTLIQEEYLTYLSEMTISAEVGAYVPIVLSHGKQVSPLFAQKEKAGGQSVPEEGIYSQKILVINSGSALPKKTLDELGGFNLEFPLDFLDHWLYWTIYKMGLNVVVVKYRAEHDLSVLNYSNISDERYESIIRSESIFYKKYNQQELKRHCRHLIARMIKQFLTLRNRKIWRRTCKEYVQLVKGK